MSVVTSVHVSDQHQNKYKYSESYRCMMYRYGGHSLRFSDGFYEKLSRGSIHVGSFSLHSLFMVKGLTRRMGSLSSIMQVGNLVNLSIHMPDF